MNAQLSRDPLGEAGGLNLYGFVQNDPVNFADPLGLWTLQVGWGFNLGLGIGGTNSKGLAISHDPCSGEWEFGVYGTIGGGVHGGANIDAVIDIAFSGNNSIKDLRGWASTRGGGIALPPTISPHAGVGLEVNTPMGSDTSPSYNFSFGVGLGTPAEAHRHITYTAIGSIVSF